LLEAWRDRHRLLPWQRHHIACCTGRISRGIELDPFYVDTAIRRWQNLTGRDAVRVSDGKLFRDIEAEKAQGNEE
jgi:hypothetical protein